MAARKCIYVSVGILKELERSLELTTNSYQRQLAAERRKTISAQEDIQILQDELERLTNKLKVHRYVNMLNDTRRVAIFPCECAEKQSDIFTW